ncbi:hypothetical protein [Paenibacillus fonticola]|uniref:hypothetical protein n=1 Tax=Paenibacillus fonticola TaxID=379896 RepID=UPI00036AB11F|nr:hypothetical protein [Paenibacillus fonticola]
MSRIDEELMELKERVARLEGQLKAYEEAPERGNVVTWFIKGFLIVLACMTIPFILIGIINFIN